MAAGRIRPRSLLLMTWLVIVPASGAAVTLINWIITHVITPRILPRLEFEESVPLDYSTMLVMPALIASRVEDVDKLIAADGDALSAQYDT